MSRICILYHGTTAYDGAALLKNGWEPNKWGMGGNCGQTCYLYLSTEYEDALWFSQEKGESTVLKVEVPFDMLLVDPEDGFKDTVEEELALTAGKVVVFKPLPASAFSRYSPEPKCDVGPAC